MLCGCKFTKEKSKTQHRNAWVSIRLRFSFNSENPFVQNGKFFWESRTAFLGFNYRFGGGKNRAKQRRRRDNREKQGGGGFF